MQVNISSYLVIASASVKDQTIVIDRYSKMLTKVVDTMSDICIFNSNVACGLPDFGMVRKGLCGIRPT